MEYYCVMEWNIVEKEQDMIGLFAYNPLACLKSKDKKHEFLNTLILWSQISFQLRTARNFFSPDY